MNSDTISIQEIRKELRKNSCADKARILKKFFKTGKGEYGEGDEFLGITSPVLRKLSRKYENSDFRILKNMIVSKYHEERLLALFILVKKFNRADGKLRKKIFGFYCRNIKYVNNWDLVDLSSPQIIGGYLFDGDRSFLFRISKSKNLWERRIAILATYYFIKRDDFEDALEISKILLGDREDLIHKAVGWMLREIGKKDQKMLESFLAEKYEKIPRTTLRYAIERFRENERQKFLKGKF